MQQATPLVPTYDENNVAICFASDNLYATYACVAIQSIIFNSTVCNKYDIVILESNISQQKKALIQSLAVGRNNFTIRFVQLRERLLEHKDLFYTKIHITIDAYSRFFIPELYQNYEKVLYLDADLVANTDVADLFNTDISGYLAAVGGDYTTMYTDDKRKKYVRDVLKMSDPANYFNSGVMLFNVKLMREYDIQSLLFKRLECMKRPKNHDQDVLNSVLENKTLRLSERWNYLSDTKKTLVLHADRIAPEIVERISKICVEKEAIVHYASKNKPWRYPIQELAQYFWRYARMTPFYECLVTEMIAGVREERKRLVQYKAKLRLYQLLAKCGHKRRRCTCRIAALREQIAFLSRV
ncbi:MAG: glycosyltransferase family 8 protein [Holosporales bacterium]|jgi:lipopolysaccharide biosynthesis glycosyltransferase|nr:glycosyltransferase family 8 protein [Holosporales bacterium]